MEKYGIVMAPRIIRAKLLIKWSGGIPNGWWVYLRDRDMNPRYSTKTRQRI